MSNLLFGTDGIRGPFGTFPLTPNSLVTLGAAIGRWATEKQSNPRIFIAHDTRLSGPFIKSFLNAGLMYYPLLLVDGGVGSTPFVSYLVQKDSHLFLGIIVSASHNPFTDNGIKLVSKEGKLALEDEARITRYAQDAPQFVPDTISSQLVYQKKAHWYLAQLQSKQFCSLPQWKIVVDCANGAMSSVAPQFFSLLGLQVITMNNKPDGTNINKQCGALYPAALQKKVLDAKADFGFAFDGDGDRLVVVTRTGKICRGDELLALLATHPLYQTTKTVVATSMSNGALANWLKSQQKELIQTPVGEKHVIVAMKQYNTLLGGESSGHLLLHDIQLTGDGLAAALRVMEAAQYNHNKELETFTPFPQTVLTLPTPQKRNLTTGPLGELLATYQTKITPGRIVARYSGTEPCLRVLVEADEETKVMHFAEELQRKLKPLL